MDESAPMVAQPTTSKPEQHWVVTRAIASAALFGFIGHRIGNALGKHIENKIAAPALRWSMGGFWALLAAYSSLKASAMERGQNVEESAAPVDPVVEKSAPPTMVEPKVKVPLSLIEVDTLKDHGQLQAAPELQRT